MKPALTSLLTPADLRHYREEGFLIVRKVFDGEEMAALADEADELRNRSDLVSPDNLRCRYQPHCQTGELLFETFDPVVDISPLSHHLAHDPRIMDRLAAIYEDEACLFKDKLIYKPPGTRGYGLHQDYIAWPGFPSSFLTVVLAIDAGDRDNGCTEVFPRFHQEGYLSLADGNYHELTMDKIDEARGIPLELRPGDVAIFGCFTPHRSMPNRSGSWRRQLFLSYNARADGGPQRDRHYREFHNWLRKRHPEKKACYFR